MELQISSLGDSLSSIFIMVPFSKGTLISDYADVKLKGSGWQLEVSVSNMLPHYGPWISPRYDGSSKFVCLFCTWIDFTRPTVPEKIAASIFLPPSHFLLTFFSLFPFFHSLLFLLPSPLLLFFFLVSIPLKYSPLVFPFPSTSISVSRSSLYSSFSLYSVPNGVIKFNSANIYHNDGAKLWGKEP